MKTPRFFAVIVAAVALSAAQDNVPSYMPQASEVAEETDSLTREQAWNEVCDISLKVLAVLDGIKDKETADAAAAPLEEMGRKLVDLAEQYEFEEEELYAYFESKGIPRDKGEQGLKRLCENDFYGSVELANMFGVSLTDEEWQPATPEMIAELQTSLQQAVAHAGLQLKGGPGTSMETAWIMPPQEAVSVEYAILRALPGNVEADRQAVYTDQASGRVYDVHIVKIQQDDAVYQAEVWFDISDYWSNLYNELDAEEEPEDEDEAQVSLYTPEQQAAALQECVGIIKEAYQIVADIKDKDTADAAVPRLVELSSRFGKLADNELEYVHVRELLDLLEAAGISEQMLKDSDEKLRKHDYYGSEALREVPGLI